MQLDDSKFSDVRDLLQPTRLTSIVDIGANSIDGTPPYHGMLQAGLCTVTGFEPQDKALERLQSLGGPHETYLPYALGDGTTRTLYQCAAQGMTSLFRPDPRTLELFHGFPVWGTVVAETSIDTRRLDDVDEIEHLDVLKIDVQGSELAVFQNGRAALSKAIAIHTEVSFVPLYENQPTFGDVDQELRAQGFIPHALATISRRAIVPIAINDDPYRGLNQLVEADVVYVRDIRDLTSLTDEQLKHMALYVHCVYQSIDLSHLCIATLAERGALPEDAKSRYLQLVAGA